MYVPHRRFPPRPDAGPCPPVRTGPTAWTLGARVGRDDVYALCGRLAELIRRTGASVVVCDVAAITRPDAGTLHVLARLRLTAQRLDCGLVLDGPTGRLRGLVALAGLSDVLPLADSMTAPGQPDPAAVRRGYPRQP